MLQFDDSSSSKQLADLREKEEERVVQATAPQLGFEYVNLKNIPINPEALQLIPEEKAQSGLLAAFQINKNNVSIAAKSPNSPASQSILQELQAKGYNLAVYLCSTASLKTAWSRYSDISNTSAETKGSFAISNEDIIELTKQIKRPEDLPALLTKIQTSNTVRKASEVIALIFAGAIALHTSDIHIEPEETTVRVRYRLDGVLHEVMSIEQNTHKRIMSRLKLLSGMILNNKAESQDGRFSFTAGDKEIEMRSSVIPGAHGESIVMRILDPSVASFSLDKIDLNPQIREAMMAELKKPNGLIITTGPTGSGKTTALYAFLRHIHNPTKKIITIENPVEYKIEGVVHTQVEGDYTFSSGLRSILRQDPDVILVGEIRDKEVAETALHAAQTGHLVFSTLHTNSAVGGFIRLIDLGIDPRVLGTSVNVILGQRLARLLCEKCKTPYDPTPEEKNIVTTILSNHPAHPALPEDFKLHKAVGCEDCSDGYKGRIGIFEAVLMDDVVEEVVLRDPREYTIREAAKKQNIPTLLEDGIAKVVKGLTSITELERVVEFPNFKQAPPATELEKPPAVKADDDFSSHIV